MKKDENLTFLVQTVLYLAAAMVFTPVSQTTFWMFVSLSFICMALYCYFTHVDITLELWKENLDKCCKNQYIKDYYMGS